MTMNKRVSCVAFVAGALVAVAMPAWPQKLTQHNVDTRLLIAYKANAAAVQAFLPQGWQLDPPASGANLNISLVDRIVDADAASKNKNQPVYRVVALSAPARNPQTGESGALLFRIFNSSPDNVPGFYKVAVNASVERELTTSGTDMAAGTAVERWHMKDTRGGTMELSLQYQRGTPTLGKVESRPRSAADPAIWRVYRFDQATDVLKSVPNNVDRIQKMQISWKVPELAKIFDGSEQVVSVTSVPLYLRQVLTPDL
jgi:hypothetical protein